MKPHLVAGLAIAVALAGCNVGPVYKRPPLEEPAPPQYKENQPGSPEAQANGWRQANPQDAMLRGKWWELFGDPELNALEEQVAVSNQTIKQAFENYMAALAVLTKTRADLYPSVSVSAGVTEQKVSGAETVGGATATGVATTSPTATRTQFTIPVSASWEPDLFGRVRNSVLESAAAAQASAALVANETLSQQATLAETFFELRGQDAQQALSNQTVADYQESLRLTQSLYRAGIDSEQDVAQAETTLRTAEANATAIVTTRAELEHAIALLTGRAAGAFSMPVRPLAATPPAVPPGVPSQLLERRPDIAAAERTMAGANALIGVGKAAYYPDLSLTGSAGLQASGVSRLISVSGLVWSLGASAAQTLLDFGARRATVRQYEAQYNADVAAYRQTVLNAFKEVEDSLVASRQLAEQAARQQLAVTAAQRYQQLAAIRYRDGLDNYLNVLTAQNALYSAQQQLVNLQISRMTAAVQLIAALGGGWDAADLPVIAPAR